MTTNHTIPEGWRLVPVEPSKDMLVAGLIGLVTEIDRFCGDHVVLTKGQLVGTEPVSDEDARKRLMDLGATMRNSVEVHAAWTAMLSVSPPPPEPDEHDTANGEIVMELRLAAARVTGGNCMFADDDLTILEHLAQRAVAAGLTDQLAFDVKRHAETPHDLRWTTRPRRSLLEIALGPPLSDGPEGVKASEHRMNPSSPDPSPQGELEGLRGLSGMRWTRVGADYVPENTEGFRAGWRIHDFPVNDTWAHFICDGIEDKEYADALVEAINFALFALSTPPTAHTPGHTDLMVTPESIDAFMEANPLPARSDGWSEGEVEAAARAHHELLRQAFPNSPAWEGMTVTYRGSHFAAMRAALATLPAHGVEPLVAALDRFRYELIAFYGNMAPSAEKAALGKLLQDFMPAPRSKQPTVNVAEWLASAQKVTPAAPDPTVQGGKL